MLGGARQSILTTVLAAWIVATLGLSSTPIERAVEVEAGATCLEATRLSAHLRMWLERDTVDDGIVVTLTGDPVDPHAATFVITRDGRAAAPRRLDAIPDDCAALHAALALAIAVAVDASVGEPFARPPASVESSRTATSSSPGARPPARPPGLAGQPPLTSVPERAPEPTSRLEPDPATARPVAPASVPERAPEPTSRLEPDPATARPVAPAVGLIGRAEGVVALGLTDGPAYGGGAVVTVRPRRRVELDLGVARLVGPHGSLRGGRVRTTAAYGLLRGCGRVEPGRARLRGCAQLAAGAQQLAGVGFAQPRTTRVPWLALGPGLDVVVPRDATVGFAAGLALWIPAIRARVVGIGDDGAVAASKPVSVVGGTASAGIVVRLR